MPQLAVDVPVENDPPRLPADAVAALRRQVRGRLLFPRDLDFGPATSGHDRSARQRPGVVVEVADAADAVAAVRVARDFGRPLVTQLTGHGPVVPSAGGLLVSTRACRTIELSGDRARIGAGVLSRDALEAVESRGLTLPLGSAAGVGVVGYLLGGGVGPLGRTYGWGSDAVTAIDVVTGDGHLRRAEAAHHPDLFWALRGGKGGLGLVTAVELRARHAPTLATHQLVYDGDAAADLLRAAMAAVPSLPDSTTVSIGLATLPPDAERPGAAPRAMAVLQVCDLAGRAAGALTAFRHLRPSSATVAGGRLSAHLRAYADDGPPTAVRRTSVLLEPLDDATIEALLTAAAGRPGVTPMVQLRQLGGALRAPTGASAPDAVGGRDAAWLLVAVLAGPAALHPDAEAALADVVAAVAPRTPGPGRARAQANFVDGRGPDGLDACWDASTARSLASVRGRYDPDGVFASRFPTMGVPARVGG